MHPKPVTSNPPLATSSTADQEVLVKVEGVSKKFCRSLKKSLWYGRPAEPAVAGCKL
jgi:hypothetical protein